MKYLILIFSVVFCSCVFAEDNADSKLAEENKKLAEAKAITAARDAAAAAALADAKTLVDKANKNEESNAKLVEKQKISDELDKWGMGFGIGVEQYRHPYIDSASLQGASKIVTTEQVYRTIPSAWLTMNWPFPNHDYGMFVGVKVIDPNANAFSSFALGVQRTFVTEKLQKVSIGLGWVTHGTKTYAKGITAGSALPAQYDDIVYEKGTENSLMLMMTVGVF